MPRLAAADSPLFSNVDARAFLVIVIAAALASFVVTLIEPRVAVPVVAVELILGIIIGRRSWASSSPTASLSSSATSASHLVLLRRVRDRLRANSRSSLRLAAWGWLFSLALAYGIGGVLAWAGVVVSLLYTGSAMATTAIGTLVPILADAGEMRTRFGTYLLGAGAVGEFGPILLITLALSTTHPIEEALILIAFIVLAVAAALLAVRSLPRGWSALERSIESSGQLAVRLAVVLVFALVALATDLGLDLLLGGFAAGVITRLALRGREVAVLESKLTAIGYGFLIPFFFILSGLQFNLNALTQSASGVRNLFFFLALFLVVRGAPALLLYRDVLDARPDSARVLRIDAAPTRRGDHHDCDQRRGDQRRDIR